MSVAEQSPPAPRGSLFRKYFIALSAAVVLPLLVNGASEAWLGYRDQRAMIDRLLEVEADGAAAKIDSFLNGIIDQLGWAVQQSWSPGTEEQQRLTALGLLRQVPAIVALTRVDGEGKERLYVSRLGLNRVNAGTDRSGEEAIVAARASRLWYGPVRFHLGSEPFMTIAVAGNRKAVGAAAAEVNLKLIWDVISAIRVGETGHAFIIDQPGRLIAHPDIDKVLRGTDDTAARAFVSLRDTIAAAGGKPVTVETSEGQTVIAAMASVPTTGWTVLAEQPLSEAYAPIYAALWRTAGLLLGGAALASALAYWLANRMSDPIRLLQQGAERVGAGQFDHRIALHSGDELEALAGSFNEMAAGLAESRERSERIAKLKRFLAPQVAELVDSGGSEALLAGQRREIVAVFGDLRGFTAFSAKAEPEAIMRLLEDYHTAIGAVVTRHEATITSYTGDGIMVLVNAPLPCPDPAHRAVTMAIEMQRAVQSCALRWRASGYEVGFGIGLAMGEATIGQIGHESRLDYAAIGPVVNLASRLCSEAADGQILLDPVAAKEVIGWVDLRPLGARQLKGLPGELVVHTVATGSDA